MARFLIVVPPLTGHILPTVAVGAELSARGHEVAWAGNSTYLGGVLPPDCRVFAVDDEFPGEPLASRLERWRGLRSATAFRFFWEDFLIPLAHSMVPGIRAAVDAFDPEVMLVDQQALAGALIARERGIAWATSATTTAELGDQYETMPKLTDWLHEQTAQLQRTYGVGEPVDLRFSDALVLAFSSEALLAPPEPLGEHIAFVGPALGPRKPGPAFDWAWLDPQRAHVLVSLGTVNQDSGDRFFAVALEALGSLADTVQGIVVGPVDRLDPPANVLVVDRVPQLELLPQLDAVLCHGGHNTTCEALAHRVPLVVAPIRDDQPAVASQVTAAGAGIRVKFGRVNAAELREAIVAVLTDPTYRDAAAVIAASFEAAGGAKAAADRLEKLT
ncbi:glycosyltransferase [Sporichthya sp.]|uniref:glycosyltransferase n=1 Tax=Sporichthya sp. TaxID=65475 RepID=UPI0017A0799B|nr:glycosyltransferase [Sporichthya sp.]MBA3742406.1 glycosyltransferase family 1 protein [Sporichthya sp.]